MEIDGFGNRKKSEISRSSVNELSILLLNEFKKRLDSKTNLDLGDGGKMFVLWINAAGEDARKSQSSSLHK